jgi:hypothetical protein
MVVIDATMLLPLLRPGVLNPAGPGGVPIDRPKERIDFLVKELEAAGIKIIIPAPALSEVLVRAGSVASQEITERLGKLAVFRIEPFDTRAAVEVAAMTRNAISAGNKKGSSDATWAKLKFDRQIVAIARVCGATTIYSDDRHLRSMAIRAKIKVIGLADLPLPAESAQLDMHLSGSASGSATVTGEVLAKEEPTKAPP